MQGFLNLTTVVFTILNCMDYIHELFMNQLLIDSYHHININSPISGILLEDEMLSGTDKCISI